MDALLTAHSLALQVRSYFTLPRCPHADQHLLDQSAELLALLAVIEAYDLGDLTVPE